MVELDPYRPLSLLGIMLIVLGFVLVILPLLVRHFPSLERIRQVPSIILWVYKRGNFCFATSPILILISIVSILIFLLRHLRR